MKLICENREIIHELIEILFATNASLAYITTFNNCDKFTYMQGHCAQKRSIHSSAKNRAVMQCLKSD
jgi:hypothetical protein